mmetsp:Transcript_2964/g.8675  ORF Transcript_2964/g.8675 Transcript_2964/m.8675 type:complete len:162 (+) Transcript_2964:138-623(+)
MERPPRPITTAGAAQPGAAREPDRERPSTARAPPPPPPPSPQNAPGLTPETSEAGFQGLDLLRSIGAVGRVGDDWWRKRLVPDDGYGGDGLSDSDCDSSPDMSMRSRDHTRDRPMPGLRSCRTPVSPRSPATPGLSCLRASLPEVPPRRRARFERPASPPR